MFVQLSHHITLITVQFTCIWPGCTLLQYAHCEQVRLNECSGGNAGGFTRIDSKDTIINKSLNATQDSGGDSKERKKAAGKELMPFGKGKGEFFFLLLQLSSPYRNCPPSLAPPNSYKHTYMYKELKNWNLLPPLNSWKRVKKGFIQWLSYYGNQDPVGWLHGQCWLSIWTHHWRWELQSSDD